MKPSLQPGIRHEHRFVVPTSKTVPALYPESEEFRAMPEVFATGFLVGLLEWACIKAIQPHLDWCAEQTVGTHIDVNHSAATPPWARGDGAGGFHPGYALDTRATTTLPTSASAALRFAAGAVVSVR
jgi:hypothetical protein